MTVEFQTNAQAFAAVIRTVLWPREEERLAKGEISRFRQDSKNRLVIGYGYDIPSRSIDTIQRDLAAAGMPLSQAAVTTLTNYKNGTITVDTAEEELISSPITPTQAENLFNIIKSTYEKAVVTRIDSVINELVANGKLTAADKDAWKQEHPGETLAASAESATLFSLQYNSSNDKPLIGTGLVTALVKGDRLAAWYEIRYRSNSEKSLGVDDRRRDEANSFGLFSSPAGPASAEESVAAAKFMLAKRQDIDTYVAACNSKGTNESLKAKLQAEFGNTFGTIQDTLHSYGLHIADAGLPNLLGLAASTGHSSPLLSAINGGRTTFQAGEIVRIPTGTVDLGIDNPTTLTDGVIGGRGVAYGVVTDTDSQGGTVRRLVQFTTTDPAEAGTISFFDATGKRIERFPISAGHGNGEITLKAQGGSVVLSISIRSGDSPQDIPISITQRTDSSVFRTDGHGRSETYYPKSGDQSLRSEYTDDQGSLITRKWDNTGKYSENGVDIADTKFGEKSRTYIYDNGARTLTFIDNGPVIERTGIGTANPVETSYHAMSGYKLTIRKEGNAVSYSYMFDNGIVAEGALGDSTVTITRPGGNASQVLDKEAFDPLSLAAEPPPAEPTPPPPVPEIPVDPFQFGAADGDAALVQQASLVIEDADDFRLTSVNGDEAKFHINADGTWTYVHEAGNDYYSITARGREELLHGHDGSIYENGVEIATIAIGAGYNPDDISTPAIDLALILLDESDGKVLTFLDSETGAPSGARQIEFGNGVLIDVSSDNTGAVYNANNTLIAVIAYSPDRATYTRVDETGVPTGVVETKWADGASAQVNPGEAAGAYHVGTVNSAGSAGAGFTLSGLTDAPTMTSDGKVTVDLGGNVTALIDSAQGTASVSQGGSSFTLSGAAGLTLARDSAGNTTIDLGLGQSVLVNESGDGQLVLGNTVTSLPPGTVVAPAAGGGFAVTPPEGGMLALSGQNGSVVTLEPGQGMVLVPDGQGGLGADLGGGRSLSLAEGGDLLLVRPGLPDLALPSGTATSAERAAEIADLIEAEAGALDPETRQRLEEGLSQAVLDEAEVPDSPGAVDMAEYLDGVARIANDGADLLQRQVDSILNLASDPTELALEGSYVAFQAIWGAAQAPTTASVLSATVRIRHAA